jgi:hypothetical protein
VAPAQPQLTRDLVARPTSIAAPSCAPNTVRRDWVVCCATVRLSDCAPVSVKPFCVTVDPCSSANGVMKYDAAPPRSTR